MALAIEKRAKILSPPELSWCKGRRDLNKIQFDLANPLRRKNEES